MNYKKIELEVLNNIYSIFKNEYNLLSKKYNYRDTECRLCVKKYEKILLKKSNYVKCMGAWADIDIKPELFNGYLEIKKWKIEVYTNSRFNLSFSLKQDKNNYLYSPNKSFICWNFFNKGEE